MNRILKYPGSKWRIADWIISLMPKHKVYAEPFFGSGAVFFNKQPAYIESVNDIDGDIVNLFKVCREDSIRLSELIDLTPYARDEFISCYQRSDDPIEQARRTLVRFWQSYGSCNRSLNTWKNSQLHTGPCTYNEWNQLPQVVLNVFSRLKNVQINNVNALTFIERYNSPDTLLYVDPPYLNSVRMPGMYKFEMTDSDHFNLLDLLKSSKSKIILSAYDNDLYNSELKDWNVAEIKAQSQRGAARIEKLYMNFKSNVTLFDFPGVI